MKQLILKLGARKTVFIITVLSVLVSMLIAATIAAVLPHASMKPSLLVSAMTPLVIAPLLSWPFVRLLFQLNRLEVEMRALATYDSLTKLLNRRVFLERAEYAFSIAKREKQGFCILAADLDLFKLINDQYGHATGDNVLALFGQVVRNVSRDSDISGRVGGEEFTFFLPNTTADEAMFFAERLHEAIRNASVSYKGTLVKFTVSIGLASFSGNNTSSLDSLLNFADTALYEAKRNGRNQTVKITGL
jgi:diguanylate cyclase (GGDEF)-like protein